MKKFNFLLLLFIAVFNIVDYGQELQAKVTIIATRVPTTVDKKIFQTLQTQLTNFINNRKWTPDAFNRRKRLNAAF